MSTETPREALPNASYRHLAQERDSKVADEIGQEQHERFAPYNVLSSIHEVESDDDEDDTEPHNTAAAVRSTIDERHPPSAGHDGHVLEVDTDIHVEHHATNRTPIPSEQHRAVSPPHPSDEPAPGAAVHADDVGNQRGEQSDIDTPRTQTPSSPLVPRSDGASSSPSRARFSAAESSPLSRTFPTERSPSNSDSDTPRSHSASLRVERSAMFLGPDDEPLNRSHAASFHSERGLPSLGSGADREALFSGNSNAPRSSTAQSHDGYMGIGNGGGSNAAAQVGVSQTAACQSQFSQSLLDYTVASMTWLAAGANLAASAGRYAQDIERLHGNHRVENIIRGVHSERILAGLEDRQRHFYNALLTQAQDRPWLPALQHNSSAAPGHERPALGQAFLSILDWQASLVAENGLSDAVQRCASQLRQAAEVRERVHSQHEHSGQLATPKPRLWAAGWHDFARCVDPAHESHSTDPGTSAGSSTSSGSTTLEHISLLEGKEMFKVICGHRAGEAMFLTAAGEV